MKKTSKLLAFIIAFSMIASTIVFPISVNAASATNLIVNGDLESGFAAMSLTGGSIVKTTSGTVTDVMFDASGAETTDESAAVNKAIKIELTDAAKVPSKASNGNMIYPTSFVAFNVPSGGGYYYIGAKARIIAEPAAAQSKVAGFRSGHYNSTVIPYSTLKTDDWVQVNGVFDASKSAQAYMQIPTNNQFVATDHYMDDIEIYKLELDKDKATNVPVNGEFKLSGPEALALNRNDIIISDGTNKVAATGVSYADGEWTIAYKGLASLTDYTLTIGKIVNSNTYSNSAPTEKTPKYTFKTKDSNLIVDGSFEGLEKGSIAVNTTTYNGASAITVVDSTTTEPQDGEKCILIDSSAAAHNGGLRFINVLTGCGVAHRFTMYAKLKNAPENGEKVTTRAIVEQRSYVLSGDPVELSATEWTPITMDFAINANDEAGRNSVHVGFEKLSIGAAEVYVDNYSLVPIAMPAFVASYDLENGATEVELEKTVTVEFSNVAGVQNNKLRFQRELTAANFTIDNDASIGAVTKVNDYKYKVKLENLAGGTTYVLGMTDVRDMFGQFAEDEISFTTVDPRPQAYPDLVSTRTSLVYYQDAKKLGATDSVNVNKVDGVYTLESAASQDKVIRHNSVVQEPGTSYIISAYVKDGNPDDGNSPVIVNGHNGHSCLASSVDTAKAKNVTVGTEWTKVSWIINAKAEGSHGTDKTLCAAHSNRGPIKGLAEGATYVPTMHIGFQFNAAEGDVLLVKDFEVRKYEPFEVTSTLADDTKNADTDDEFTLTFSSKPYELEADTNVVLTKSGEKITGKLTVTPVSDTEYKVAYAGLEVGGNYNISLENVQSMSAVQAELSIDFTTAVAFNILKKNGYDYSFEKGTIPATEGSVSASVVTRGEGMPAPVDGEKYAKAVGNGRIRFNNIGTGKAVKLEAGKTYEVSYYARTLPDENGDATTGNAELYFSAATPASNTIYPVNPQKGTVEISSGKWTKVTGSVTIAEASPELDNRYDASATRSYLGIHVGTSISNCSAVYYDNFEIIEMIPEFTVTTTPENGAQNVKTSVVTFKFTSAPESFEAEDIAVSGGASVAELTKVSEFEYKATLENLEYTRPYTITLAELVDTYGQTISGFETSFTMAAAPAISDANIVANKALGYYSDIDVDGDGVFEQAKNTELPYEMIDGVKTYTLTRLTNAKQGARAVSLGGFKEGKSYEMTMEIKYAEPEEEGVTRTGNVVGNLEGNAGVNSTVIEKTDVIPSDEWQTLRYVFTLTAQPAGRLPHYGVMSSASAPILLRNFTIKEYAAPFTVTSTPASGETDVDLNTEVLVKFNNVPYNLDETTLVVKKGNEVITSGYTIEKIDECNYKFIFSNLDLATTYSIGFEGLIDEFGQELVAEPISFTTTVKSNMLQDKGYDFSFENGVTSYLIGEGTQKFEVIKASDVLIKAPHGEKILKISGRSNNARVRINSVGAGTENCVEAGKKYLVSYYIRTAPDADGNATTAQTGVFISNASPATNTVMPSKNNTGATVNISSGEWTYVEYIVDMVENPYTGTPSNAGFHIGASITGSNSVYIDNFVLKEFIPKFEVTTTPENGEVKHGASTVTYTFTNTPASFTTANVSITGGNATVDSITKVSDTIYMVSFDGFEYGTEYTVDITGVVDVYDQPLSNSITFTTCSGNPAADNNILANPASDAGFELSPLGAYAGRGSGKYGSGALEGGCTEIFTIVDEASEGVAPYEGNQMLKIVANGDVKATSFRLNNTGAADLTEIGKTYQLSFYARTVNEGETVSGSMMLSRSGVTSNAVNIESVSSSRATVSNEWTQISAVVKVVKNADCTNANATNQGFHMGVNINGIDVYIDNFEIMEMPAEDLHIISSTPANDSSDIEINVGKILVNYSESLHDSYNPAADGAIKLYKGEEDVSNLITGIEAGFGNSSVEIAVDELENGTQYKLVLSGVKDFLGRVVDSEIMFVTKSAVSTSGGVVLDDNDSAIDLETVTADMVKGASINVSNAASSNILMPLYIYTVYDAEGHLVKSGTTSFAGELVPGEDADLAHNFDGIDLNDKILTLYLVNSYKSLQLAAEPIVLDFTNPVQP